MATQAQWREAQDFAKVLEAAERKRLIHVHRPFFIHDRAPGVLPEGFDALRFLDLEEKDEDLPKPPDPKKLKKCPCGCDSKLARIVQNKTHLDVLIDRVTGERRVRSHLSEEGQAKFDELCQEAERVEMPFRCSRAQYRFYTLDGRKRPKVRMAFGGVRAGKSTVCGDSTADEALENGGRGAALWVVAPTREKTGILLRKLVTGDIVGKGVERRRVLPIFPPALVRYFPESDRAGRQWIDLIDGTRIHLKYASKKGENMRGESPQHVSGDEICAIPHVENYQEILDRLLESGGGFDGATTPDAGHWAEEVLYKAGQDIDEWDGKHPIVHMTWTCADNPWVSLWHTRETLKAKKDRTRIQSSAMGKWVRHGERLWTEWDPAVHQFRGHGRTAEDYGLKNLTPRVAKRFFKRHSGALEYIGGMDFNLWPMSVVVCQIACPPGVDETNPDNWILLVLDEVVQRAANIIQFADFLATQAGAYRGLDPSTYKGLAIACDPSGAQKNAHMARLHGMSSLGSTFALEMERKGFTCKPCNKSTKGKAIQPSSIDNISLMHRLMADKVRSAHPVLGGRTELPRLLVHEDRCKELIYSFETQEATARGTAVKATKVADRKSGPSDAARYIAWAMFHERTYRRKSKVLNGT